MLLLPDYGKKATGKVIRLAAEMVRIMKAAFDVNEHSVCFYVNAFVMTLSIWRTNHVKEGGHPPGEQHWLEKDGESRSVLKLMA